MSTWNLEDVARLHMDEARRPRHTTVSRQRVAPETRVAKIAARVVSRRDRAAA